MSISTVGSGGGGEGELGGLHPEPVGGGAGATMTPDELNLSVDWSRPVTDRVPTVKQAVMMIIANILC